MTDPNEAAERLARHAPFLRALAGALLGGGDAADDVLQDAWLATRGSAPIDPRRERGWLAGVVRNLSLHRLRERSRRAARESARQGAREVPTPHQVLEEEAARRRVLDAVLGLEEPWRATLLLRFWEGRTLAEVAAQTGAPLETVRARQKRALELLRQRLDREFGSRASWGAVLAPIVGMTAAKTGAAGAATTIPFLWGSITMGMKTWVVAAGALAAVAASIYWWSFSGAEKATAGAGGRVEQATAQRSETASPEVAIASAPSGDPNETRASADPAARSIAPARVTGRFLDRSGSPVAGVHVCAATRERSTFELGPARFDPMPSGEPPIVDSNDRGEFTWTEPGQSLPETRNSYSWFMILSGFAQKSIQVNVVSGSTTALGDIVLDPGGDLAGHVVDSSGKPVRAIVELWSASEDGFNPATARLFRTSGSSLRSQPTNADGVFEILGAPCQKIRVAAYRKDTCYAFTDPIALAPGERRGGLRLALEPLPADCTIEGIVVKPDGTPCAGAEIGCQLDGGLAMFQAERDGRFQHRLHVPGGPVRYEAVDPKHEFGAARAAAVARGTRDLVLTLEPARACTLQIRSSAGGAVPQARLRLDDGFIRPMGNDLFLNDPSGNIKIVALPSPFKIEIEAAGHETKVVGPLTRETLPESLPVTLRKLASLSGRVLREEKPVAGAWVTLSTAVVNGRTEGFACRSMPVSEVQPARTDAAGRFELHPTKAIAFAFVRVETGPYPGAPNPMIAAAELGPFAYDPVAGRDGLDVILGEGGALEGKLLLPTGRDATGIRVGISRGDGHPREMTLAADGQYRFLHLIPGKYAMRILDEHAEMGMSYSMTEPTGVEEIPFDFVIDEGRTTHHDHDLSSGADAVLAGHLALGGKSWDGFEARAVPFQQKDAEVKSTVAPDGRFRLPLPHGGQWNLTISRPADRDSFEIRLQIDVAAMGETKCNYSPPTGSIRGSVQGMAATPPVGAVYWWRGKELPFVSGRVVPAADGGFTIDSLPVGKVRITVVGPDNKELARREVEVSAGNTTEIRFP